MLIILILLYCRRSLEQVAVLQCQWMWTTIEVGASEISYIIFMILHKQCCVQYYLLAGINVYSGDVSAERIKSGNVTGSGVKIQFKSPVGKILGSEKPLDKNVSHL